MTFDECLKAMPIIAIIRGVRPHEAVEIGGALLRAGVRIIETPFNSPDPLASIRALAAAYGQEAIIGGGTILRAEEVDRLAEAGGKIVVAPNTAKDVIARALQLGLTPMPGFFTPSEAFSALGAGARELKLFPAVTGGVAHMQAIRAVLPQATRLYAVGGVRAQDFKAWRQAGAAGLALGSDLYKPGMPADEVHARALQATQACREV